MRRLACTNSDQLMVKVALCETFVGFGLFLHLCAMPPGRAAVRLRANSGRSGSSRDKGRSDGYVVGPRPPVGKHTASRLPRCSVGSLVLRGSLLDDGDSKDSYRSLAACSSTLTEAVHRDRLPRREHSGATEGRPPVAASSNRPHTVAGGDKLVTEAPTPRCSVLFRHVALQF